MDDMFSSMTDVRLSLNSPSIIETMETDMDDTEIYRTESFAGLIKQLKTSPRFAFGHRQRYRIR